MKYYKVTWMDANGENVFSDPIEKWSDAETYRREIGGDAVILRY